MSDLSTHHDENLFKDFLTVSPSEWKNKIEKDLKGKPFEHLKWELTNGISLAPFFTRQDIDESPGITIDPGQFPYKRGNIFHQSGADWQVVQHISLKKADIAREKVRYALTSDIIAFDLFHPKLSIDRLSFSNIIREIDFQQHALHVGFSDEFPQLIQALQEAIDKENIKAEWLTGTLLNHPFEEWKYREKRIVNQHEWDQCAKNILLADRHPYFRCLGIDVRWIFEYSGNEILELAVSIAILVEYLVKLPQLNSLLTKEKVLENVFCRFSIGSSFFIELCKLRAFRMLYAKVVSIMEVEEPHLQSPFILSQNSFRNKALSDIESNLLRQTSEVISAVLGGANAIIVPDYHMDWDSTDFQSQRLARNIQYLLRYESYLNQVIDPGGGSYYIESLTDEIANEAWKLFQEIEQKGGIIEAYNSGFLHKQLHTYRGIHQSAFDEQQKILVGVNKYVQGNNTSSKVLEEIPYRLAHKLEKIIQRHHQFIAENGEDVYVLIWAVDDSKDSQHKIHFAKEVFSIGGFMNQEIATSAEGGKSLVNQLVQKEIKSSVIVLGGSQESIAALEKSQLSFIRENLSGILCNVGQLDDVSQEKIDFYFHRNGDIVNFLDRLITKLGM